ncbi:hypothetical protein [Knoellia subterranea]|uniref:Secreted protein n=1 Tax=Knoellia subterranea KCTC 19937 TaxID=1385521 RepID=A0A0A0JGN0_9MICO|nr:hypothetical protein [Knoellia subterranea]KGN36535.1 hypothetical protein N803_04400 [Knoellia subterranea KCTC 19937]
MSHTTSIRRFAATAGAAGILALSMAAPASARPDPGNGSQSEWSCQVNCYAGPDGPGMTTSLPPVDDSAIEFLQLGAGVLAGVAIAERVLPSSPVATTTWRTPHEGSPLSHTWGPVREDRTPRSCANDPECRPPAL